ncbi:PaaI family thioesterase [Legionella rowbothamii]|uniref:PaaI family thioesterase n=1 Tax=Legionella rowbothamii TaxID=96229 RepID=UPI0010561379|nr:PaaI family thioesterase [Legionella rowbothamii]
MSPTFHFKLFFWYFCHFKVAMIGYLKPRLIKIDEEDIVIRLPLRRRSRNHLNSMYFGALSVGADLAGGIHAFYHAELAQCKVSLVFKSFQAQFLRRPESDVYFVCTEGAQVKAMLEESQKTKERINKPIKIGAYTDYPGLTNKVADFTLELSVKVIS